MAGELQPLAFVPPTPPDEQLQEAEAVYMVALQAQRDATLQLLTAQDAMLALLTDRMFKVLDPE